jgi:hypothetical protein
VIWSGPVLAKQGERQGQGSRKTEDAVFILQWTSGSVSHLLQRAAIKQDGKCLFEERS